MSPACFTALFAHWEKLCPSEEFCLATFLRAALTEFPSGSEMGRGGPDRRGEAWVWEGEVYRGVMDPSEVRSLEELLALYGGSLKEALQGLVKRPCSPVSR